MTKQHIIALIAGIFFWGVLWAVCNQLFFESQSAFFSVSLIQSMGGFVLMTVVLTVMGNYLFGGFGAKIPEAWFFWPLLSLVLCAALTFMHQ